MARARNNITRLPFEIRVGVIAGMLADGATYDEVRDNPAVAAACRDRGGVQLHNCSFLAYRKSKEYQDALAAKRQSNQRFIAKRIKAMSIGEAHGVDSVIKVTEATLVEQLQELIDNAEDDELTLGAMSKAAAILNNLKQSKAETRLLKLQRENENLKTELAAQKEKYEGIIENLTGKQNQKVDPAAVQNQLDDILGLNKKK